MGVKEILFGSSPKAKETSQPALSPEQERALQQLLASLTGSGAAPLTSPAYTQLSSLENTSLAGLEQMAVNFDKPTEATTTSQDALKRIIDTGDSGFADYYKTNIADPVTRTFNEDILPQINRQYSNQFFGTDRGNALDRSQRRVLEALTSGAGEALKDYRGQTITAATALPGTEFTSAQAGATDIQALLAALTGGGTPRKVATTERDKQLEALLAALGIKTRDNNVTALPGQTGLVQSFLGSEGGSNLAAKGIGALIASDRRLKSDVRRVGTHRLGIGIYDYKILGYPARGVMADEVALVIPRAVVEMPSGYLAVDYAMIGG